VHLASLNAQLLNAVTFHRAEEVRRLLEQGADSNYDSCAGKSAAEKEHQPNTPLRMVVFCISDSLLNDDGLRDFKLIAQLLIQHGAHTRPAMELAEQRYGQHDITSERNPFSQVVDVIALADEHSRA
jgi:hypothetical protein